MWNAFGPRELSLSLQIKPQHLTQKLWETTDQIFFFRKTNNIVGRESAQTSINNSLE